MTYPAPTVIETPTSLNSPVPTAKMNGHCRFAVPSDRLLFVKLWWEFVRELYTKGSTILPDEHNMYLFRDYFDAYTTGKLDGAVAFWSPTVSDEPVGVAMAGDDYQESLWHLDHKGERWGQLWGLYVQPPWRGTRAGLQMELFGESRLLTQGFHQLRTTVWSSNPLGQANWRHWHEARGVKQLEYVIVGRLGSAHNKGGV